MFDKGELKDCHEQCLTLLQFPYLPNYTRIQTLQLAAASTKAFHAGKEFLADAMKLIEQFESAGPPSKQLAKFQRYFHFKKFQNAERKAPNLKDNYTRRAAIFQL